MCENDMPSLGYQNGNMNNNGNFEILMFLFPFMIDELDDDFEDYKDWCSAAHNADTTDHYTERTSPRTNHLLSIERQMESSLNCSHFNTVRMPSWDSELEGWR